MVFFKSNFEKRSKFIKNKKYLFEEISNFINNCIDHSKNVLMLCSGNSILSKNISSKKIYIKEISDEYKINYNSNSFYKDDITEQEIFECDTVVVSDIEHQINPASNLLALSKLINDDAKIIILSKNMFWMVLIKLLKFFIPFSPKKNNFFKK